MSIVDRSPGTPEVALDPAPIALAPTAAIPLPVPVAPPEPPAPTAVPAPSTPGEVPAAATPGTSPLTRVIQLEQEVLRLRRDLSRMHRVVALLEQTVAVERILATHPGPRRGLWDIVRLWLAGLWGRRSA